MKKHVSSGNLFLQNMYIIDNNIEHCLQNVKENYFQPWILYPGKISIKYEGKTKIFLDI